MPENDEGSETREQRSFIGPGPGEWVRLNSSADELFPEGDYDG